MDTLITVGIVTFDRKELLLETINSIISQDLNDNSYTYEIVIGNDNPQRHVDSDFLGIENKRIRYVNNKNNLGEWANFNNLINHSKGQYIVILNDDDLFSNNFLKLVSRCIATYNFPDCICTGFTEDYEQFEKAERTKIDSCDVGLYQGKNLFNKYLHGTINIFGTGIVFRKDMLRMIGGYGAWHTSAYSDTYLAFKTLVEFDKVVYVDKELIYYRDHEGSQSSYRINSYLWLLSQEEFVSKMERLIYSNFNECYNQHLLQLYKFWILGSMRARMMRLGSVSLLFVVSKYIGFLKKFQGCFVCKIKYLFYIVFFITKVLLTEAKQKVFNMGIFRQ